jgi:hypothetical protein
MRQPESGALINNLQIIGKSRAIHPHSIAIRIGWAILVKLTPRPVRVVDAVWGVLATVLTIRIRDAVRVKLVGI